MYERRIMSALGDQREELLGYSKAKWCTRREARMVAWGHNLAQVVTGVRRSGKSTLGHMVLRSLGVTYGYINFDDDRLFSLRVDDLQTVLTCVYRLYGPDTNYLFFDEIQNVEGWHLFVSRLLRQGIHVMVTGSNAKLLSSELATHLTGRYMEIRLYPFSFSEQCVMLDVPLHPTTSRDVVKRELAFNDYLREGGMPEMLYLPTPVVKRNYITGLIETIVTKDISTRYHLRHTESLRRIANYLLANICQTINYESLLLLSGVGSKATLQKYVAYLSQAFLIYRIQRYSYKCLERQRNEKAYAVDLAFATWTDHAPLAQNMGWRLENAVCIELMRRHNATAGDIYYYKPTARGREVDFVVCRQGVPCQLVQVALNMDHSKTFQRETLALAQAAEALHCDNLYVITMDPSQDVTIHGHTIHICNAPEWFADY